ncbi:MAG: AmmeMemoRadiSam system protein B [Candidatus Omnitrophota bacterium]
MKAYGIKVLIFFFCCLTVSRSLCYAGDIKEPNAAGTFYPGAPGELSQAIEGLLDSVDPQPTGEDIFALIMPHAGYGYSGRTAAFGYKSVYGKAYKTVVIIGRSHHYNFRGVSVYARGKFRTPLGDIEVDEAFAQSLLDPAHRISFMPEVFLSGEHAVEVQLPFLQKTLKDFKIVPVITGDMELSDCRGFAGLLKKAIGGRNDILVVASTDMYHGADYGALQSADKLAISLLKNMDSEGLYHSLREGKTQLCGGPAVVTVLILAKELGYDKLQVLDYTDSAQVVGAKSDWMVGYVSCVISSGKEAGMLNKAQRRRLLEIARRSIREYLNTGKNAEFTEIDPALTKETGVFVTLHKSGDLRGCIGNMQARGPLYMAVRDMAVEAAVSDPRFLPVKPDELDDIDIEISALSPLRKVESLDEIQMGVHGVLVKRGFNSGVFLPQVAVETGWSKEEFLDNLCSHKAGLSPGAWKDKNTQVYIFTAEVFSEKEERGNE